MLRLRNQGLFSVKPTVLFQVQKRAAKAQTANAIDIEQNRSDLQTQAQLEQALSADREKAYTAMVTRKTALRRVSRICWSVSLVANVLAWFGFFLWYMVPRQFPPKIEGDSIHVTLISPDLLPPPKPPPQLPEVLQPSPPVIEDPKPTVPEPPDTTPEFQQTEPIEKMEVLPDPPPPTPEVEQQPPPDEVPTVVQQDPVTPLELDTLGKPSNEPLTSKTMDDALALDTLQQTDTDSQTPKTDTPELTEFSPLAPKSVTTNDKTAEQIDPELALSTLRQQVGGRSAAEQRTQNPVKSEAILDTIAAQPLSEPTPKTGRPASQKRQTSPDAPLKLTGLRDDGKSKTRNTGPGKALPLDGFQAPRKPTLSGKEPVNPAVTFNPLRGKSRRQKTFEVKTTSAGADLKLQTLPKLQKPPEISFPPVDDIQKCTVVLRLWIETDGTPSDIRVYQMTPAMDKDKENQRLFHDAAIKAAKESRFEPARRDGKPVRLRIQIPIEFDQSTRADSGG
jgi:TonB family protein